MSNTTAWGVGMRNRRKTLRLLANLQSGRAREFFRYGGLNRQLWKSYTILMVSVALAGCAGSNSHNLLNKTAIQTPASSILGAHYIYVTTTRQPAKTNERQVFSSARSLHTQYARINVTVPSNHKIGHIEKAPRGAESNPSRNFAATRAVLYKNSEDFESAINADIKQNDGRVLVFVHGYNNGFDDAVYRLTQIVQDTNYPGTAVLFSWASAGKATGYIYDKESANAARDDLEATLRMLAGSQAGSIDIIAHSMGNWIAMEALRQLAIAGDRDLSGKLGYVVLASPDIDVDVFKKQMMRYGKPNRPFTVLLSADDRALGASSLISGTKPRVGDYSDANNLAQFGVNVVDLSKAKSGDRMNHAKFADNPLLVELLGKQLQTPAALAEPVSLQSLEHLGAGLGQAVGSVADIAVTTPLKVLGAVTR